MEPKPFIAVPVHKADLYKTSPVVDLGKKPSPCCLAFTRNLSGTPYKFCPSCAKPINYSDKVDSITSFGKKLGVTEEAVKNGKTLLQLLAPLRKEGYLLHGPCRTTPEKDEAVLVGYAPVCSASPERGISFCTVEDLKKVERKLIAEMESKTARKAHVSAWFIE